MTCVVMWFVSLLLHNVNAKLKNIAFITFAVACESSSLYP